MANPAYGKCYPYENADQKAYEAEWRHLAGAWGDGIVNAFGGGGAAFSLTKSASSRVVTMNLNEFRMRGIHFEPTTSTLDLTLPPVTGTKTRADRIIAKLDPTAKSITFEVKVGAEISSGVPTPPALVRANGGVWEHSLWVARGTNVAASALTYSDQRLWLTQTMKGYGPPSANDELLLGVSDGAQYLDLSNNHTWVLGYPAGLPVWSDQDSLNWVAFPRSGSPGTLVNYVATPLMCKRRGIVYLRGGLARKGGAILVRANSSLDIGLLPVGYRPELTVNFPVTTTFGGASSGAGRLNIEANGVVNFATAADVTWVRLDCSFPVEV